MLVCEAVSRTRLLAAVSCALAITVVPAGCGSGNDAENQAQDQADAIAGDIDGVLGDAQDELTKLSKLPAVRSADPRSCSAEMKAQERSKPDGLGALGAAKPNGNLDCLSIPIDAPINIADRVYFLRALGTDGLGVSDFQIGRATGLLSIGLGYPVSGGSKDGYAIVLTVLDLDWLRRQLSHELDAGTVDLLVTDDHGTVLTRLGETKTPTGENLGSDELVQAMLTDLEGSGEFASDSGNLAYGYTTVPASGDEIHVAVGVRP
jgi:hypothetical protein